MGNNARKKSPLTTLYLCALFQGGSNSVERIFNYCSCNYCIDKSTQNIESFAYSARILSGFCRCRLIEYRAYATLLLGFLLYCRENLIRPP